MSMLEEIWTCGLSYKDRPVKSGSAMVWAVPVLGREGVERQELNAHLAGNLSHLANGVDTVLVAETAFLTVLLGPTPVAVHDDGDVARDARLIQLLYFVTE